MTNPCALVVGGSRGIGAAVAERLCEDGFHPVLVGRTEADLAAVARRSGAADIVTADVSTTGGIDSLVEAASRFEPEVVVALARMRAPWKRLTQVAPGELGRSVDSHLDYLIALAKAILPAQRAAGHGRWVFVSSTVTRMGGSGQAVYSAHKLAMEGLCRTLALEEGRNGITANVVSAGFVESEGTRSSYSEDLFAALSSMNSLGRAGTPQEVAHMVAALADRRAGFITGQTILVGGGVELAWPARLAAHSPALALEFAAQDRSK